MAVLLAGVVMVLVGLLDLVGYGFKEVGNWGYWSLGVGAILLLIGGIWFALYRINVRKFNKLMEEKSKATFVKKLDDVEYLAWRLPMKFEERLSVKKKDFGMK
jgi:bacteriorhodopsin